MLTKIQKYHVYVLGLILDNVKFRQLYHKSKDWRLSTVKRYLLFSGDDCYLCGGVEDFVRSFSSQEAIIQHLKSLDEKG